jgi:hypothetical protein
MPVQDNELHTPKLPPQQKGVLLTTLNAVEAGTGLATVHMTYRKQTKSKPRLAGEDYVAMPGITPEVQIGQITSVFRLKDNPKNRKAGTVGHVRFRLASMSRADGVNPTGFTTVIPAGITSFALTGFQPSPAALQAQQGQQGQAQTPPGV